MVRELRSGKPHKMVKKKRRLRRPTDRRKLRQDPSSNRPAVKEKSDTIGEILNMARILKLLGVYCEFS